MSIVCTSLSGPLRRATSALTFSAAEQSTEVGKRARMELHSRHKVMAYEVVAKGDVDVDPNFLFLFTIVWLRWRERRGWLMEFYGVSSNFWKRKRKDDFLAQFVVDHQD